MKGIKNNIIIRTIIVLSISLLIVFPTVSIAVEDEETIKIEQMKRAVIEVAEAYLNKGDAFQYEQYMISKYINNNGVTVGWQDVRRNKYSTPEMGTVENPVFLDCSSYVFAVYKQVFGIECYSTTKRMMESIEEQVENENYNYAPYYELISDESDLQTLKSILEIGDIIVLRRASGTGHAMLYIGNDTIIHSGGSDYNYDTYEENYETNGTIRKDNISYILEEEGASYLKAKNENGEFIVSKVAIIRPLSEEGLKAAGLMAEDKELEISEATQTRLDYPGMIIEKKATLITKSTASLGEEITYTTEIINNSNEEYLNVNIKDYIPEYTSYKDMSINNDGVVEDNKIEWNIEKIEANKKIKLSFTVIVDDEINNIGKEIVSKGTVGNIETNEIKYQIGNKLNQNEKNAIVQTAYTYYNKSKEGAILYPESFETQDIEITKIPEDAIKENPISLTTCGFINAVYYNSLGIDLNLYYTKDVLNSVFEKWEVKGQSQMYKLKEVTDENTLRKMLVSDLYGGIRVATRTEKGDSLEEYSLRTRGIYERNLEIGDIIAYGFDSTENADIYLYLGDSKLMIMTANNGVVLLEGTKAEAKIESLLGRSKFVILRPSLVYSKRNITEKAEQRIKNPIVEYAEYVEKDDSYGNIINRLVNRFYNHNNKSTTTYETENRDLEKPIEEIEVIDNIGVIYSIYFQGFGIKLPNSKEQLIEEEDMVILKYNKELKELSYNNTPIRENGYLIYREDLKRGDILIYKFKDENYLASINLGSNKIFTFSEKGMRFERVYADFLYKIRPAYKENTLEELYVIRPSLVYDLDLNDNLEVDINYSTKEFTNKDVIVTISSVTNKGIRENSGWTLSSDGTEMTKIFTSNTNEEVVVYDFGENATSTNINISNIDKTAPKIEGVEEGKVYNIPEIKPVIIEENLDTVEITKDGEKIEKFKNDDGIIENGQYKFKVIDKAGNTTEVNFLVKIESQIEKLEIKLKKDSTYEIEESYITKVKPNTTTSDIINSIETNGEIEIYKGTTKIIDEKIKLETGMIIKISLSNQASQYKIVVTGDLNGDGQMNEVDLLMLARYKVNLDKNLKGEYLRASDIVENGVYADNMDLLKMARIIVGLDEF